jgi:hypothetical protein
MVTDSRSFMSYPRHEYFRRVLCNVMGREIERGELPADEALVGTMIRNICHRNAQEYLALPESMVQRRRPEARNGVTPRPHWPSTTDRPIVLR